MDAFQRSGGMWKRFKFFDKHAPEAGTSGASEGSVAGAAIPEDASCCSSGLGTVTFGCRSGDVCSFASGWVAACAFEAHDQGTLFVHHLSQRNLLLTLGRDLDASAAAAAAGGAMGTGVTLKVWDYDRMHSTGGPVCIRTIRPFTSKQPADPGAEVTAFAVAEERLPGLAVAIGLSSGTVLLVRGDVVRDRVSRTKIAVASAPPSSDVSSTAAVTNLAFTQDSEAAGGGASAMYTA